MNDETNESFDLRDAFDAEVRPLVDALIRKCEELGLPMFCIACVSSGEGGDHALRSHVLPENRRPDLICAHSVLALYPEELTMATMIAGAAIAEARSTKAEAPDVAIH